MAIVNFVNYPDTTTPITATNLNKIQEGNIYSTSEIEIGKWINNKPLYRKVVNFYDSISANTQFTKAHGIQNADVVLIKDAYFININNNTTYNLNIVGGGENITENTHAIVNRTNIYLYGNVTWSSNWRKIIVLEYTKTTD